MSTAPRHNLYQAIHKALRACMSETLIQVGRTDPGDAAERQATCALVDSLLTQCHQHLHHENDFLHAAMEQRCPGSAAALAHEHDEHVDHIARLTALNQQALHADVASQADTWQTLYLELSLFVADNFAHMVREERDHNAVLWQHFSDEELDGIHHALVSSIPPEEMGLTMRWMIPQLSHPERVGMFSGMRQGMPAEVFAAQMAQTQALLDERNWRKLNQTLAQDAPLREAA